MRLLLYIGIVSIIGMCAACSGKRPSNLGAQDGTLRPCPESPNCVSSFAADAAHRIDPLKFTGGVNEGRDALVKVISSMKRAKVVTAAGTYVYAEYTSALFRFVDDVEFLFDGTAGVIHVRSASRVGYGDMGVNRKRVEEIRRLFNEATGRGK